MIKILFLPQAVPLLLLLLYNKTRIYKVVIFLNLRILNYFLTVAQEQNITKAAEILHITQPTLSRQLTQLEDELGIKLFDRSGHKLQLTDSGRFLFQRGQEITQLINKTEEELTEQELNLSGTIYCASGELYSMHFFAKLLAQFQEKYPLVQFDFFSGTSDVIRDRMNKGLVDIAILVEPIDTTNYNFIRLPNFETWCVLMNATSPLAEKKYITVEDLYGKSIIMPGRNQIRNEIYNWLGKGVKKMKIIGHSTLNANTAVLLTGRDAYGIVINPRTYDKKNLRAIPLMPPLSSNAVLAWSRQRTNSIVMQKFVDFIKEQLQ